MKKGKKHSNLAAQSRYSWAWYVWLVLFLIMQSGWFVPQSVAISVKETLAVTANNTCPQPKSDKQAHKASDTSQESEKNENSKNSLPELKPAYWVGTSSVSVVFFALDFHFWHTLLPSLELCELPVRKVATALLPFFQKTFCHHIAINAP